MTSHNDKLIIKEQLYLPALTIQLGNRQRINEEIVRKESVHVVRCKVFIDNHPHPLRIVLGNKRSRKPDTLVADESCMHVNLPVPDDLKAHVILCPCNEICLSKLEVFVKSPEVHIALIQKIIGTCLDRQDIKPVHVIYLALSHPDERGDGSSQVQKRMHLHGTAVLLVFCPWTEFQTKLNRTAVKGIDHFVKAKTAVIILVQLLRTGYQHHCKVAVYLPVLSLVHISESGLGDEFHSGMIELGGEHCQRRFDVTKACTIGELGIAHHTELVTAGELQSMEVSIVFVNTFLELILWNQIHQLREDGFSDRHNESKLDKYYIQQNEIFIEKFTNRYNNLNIS